MTTRAQTEPPGPPACPQCGRVLPADAPAGNCPACLSRLGLVTSEGGAAESAPPVLAEPGKVGISRTVFGAAADTPALEQLGDQFERYRLLEKIGEGGCGVVYLAEQVEPVRRRVALKIIKPGMDTQQVIARFEAERQALAMMDHPNIAKILDGGVVGAKSEGRSQKSAGEATRQSAGSFLPASFSLHTSGHGRPYFVMELVRGVRITEYCDENDLSTPQRLELFCQVCHAVQHAHQKGVIHRDLKPSNILVTINDGVPVPKVIDFGVAKAIEQRLTDKTIFTEFHQFIGTPAYMSPEQALMTSLDIDTRSDIYSLGVLLYELLTGRTPLDTPELLKAGVDEMRRTIREQEPPRPSNRLSTLPCEDLTTTARRRSTNPPSLIHAVSGDLDWIVMKCLEKDRGRRYETANGLAADLQRHLNNEPVVARPPSALYTFRKLVRRHKLGFAAGAAVGFALCVGLGVAAWQYREKNRAYLQARADAARARKEAVLSQQIATFLQDTLNGAGPFIAQGRDTTILREILDQTATRLATELQDQPEVEVFLRSTLGNVYNEVGDLDKAEAMFRRMLEILRNQPGDKRHEVALAQNALGGVLRWQQKFPEAEQLTREALALTKSLPGTSALEVAQLLGNLSFVLEPQGKLPEAAEASMQSIAILRKALGPTNSTVAAGLINLGNVRLHQNNLNEAERAYREAADIYEKLPPSESGGANSTIQVAALDNLGRVLEIQGRLSDAEPFFRAAWDASRQAWGDDHPQSPAVLGEFVWVLTRQGKVEEAEQVLAEALRRAPANSAAFAIRGIWYARRGWWKKATLDAARALELGPTNPNRYQRLGPLLVQTGDLAGYRAFCRKALAQFHDTRDPFIAERIAKTCLILPDPAVDVKAASALADFAVNAGESTWGLPWFQVAKALALYRLGRFPEAIEWSRKSLAEPDRNQNRDLLASVVLAMAQHQSGQRDAARTTLQRVAELEAELPALASGDLGDDWPDWIIVRTLAAEARTLILKNASPAQPGEKATFSPSGDAPVNG